METKINVIEIVEITKHLKIGRTEAEYVTALELLKYEIEKLIGQATFNAFKGQIK